LRRAHLPLPCGRLESLAPGRRPLGLPRHPGGAARGRLPRLRLRRVHAASRRRDQRATCDRGLAGESLSNFGRQARS
jgi:hypothetical protein